MNERTELIGGREKREIRIVDYDPTWPARFAEERDRIANALGAVARRVDHIGSTSVPGLAAKPIIDIQVSVPDVDDEDAYLELLSAAGYQLRVREPAHRMMRTPERDVHVHLCTIGSAWERPQLLFRDWLRHDDADRAAYEQLKRELAQRDWSDMNAYADAKGPLITEIGARAQAWADATGWTP
ncbi:GrpB family protein [Nocardia sp. NPDC049149]|uniref:GrpB family protein n=1 Tax=Nocardia sp. NPDC049149 TaxID=3364315 RepID=UPI0037206683